MHGAEFSLALQRDTQADHCGKLGRHDNDNDNGHNNDNNDRQFMMRNNGNKTEWSPIQSVII